jgi:uncharacterized protein (TIGR02145 family)
MKISDLLFSVCLLGLVSLTSQAQVGIGTNSPDASAQLELVSTTKGFLPPRMTTTQRNAITSPATGLVIFNTSTNSLEFKTSTGWDLLITSSSAAVSLPTTVIGTQQWLKENLDVITYRNGDIIPQVSDATAWAALTTGAWCWYSNDPANGAIYGKLYNWYAVNDSRGLAPKGWHIPSDAEWTTLGTTLGGDAAAGVKMKTTGTSNWTSPNSNATNESGFAGLPGGYRESNGTYISFVDHGNWWSATDGGTTSAWIRNLAFNRTSLNKFNFLKKNGYSIRCLRD